MNNKPIKIITTFSFVLSFFVKSMLTRTTLGNGNTKKNDRQKEIVEAGG